MKSIQNLHNKRTMVLLELHQYFKTNLIRHHNTTSYLYKPCSTHRNVPLQIIKLLMLFQYLKKTIII